MAKAKKSTKKTNKGPQPAPQIGVMAGGSMAKRQLKPGSTVVCNLSNPYAGHTKSPKFQERCVIAEIKKSSITLVGYEHIDFPTQAFFKYFTQIKV